MRTNCSATSAIHSLIARVEKAVASERNRQRGRRRPAISVGIEDSIAWSVLFGFDANTYFSDPLFYFEQNLRHQLWRFEHIDDDTPIALQVPAWLGHYPEYTFLGMEVSFTEKGVPDIQRDHPLSRDPDLKLLKQVNFKTSGWMPRVLRWYEELCNLSEHFSAGRIHVSFPDWTRGCLDLAIQLRGYENFVLDTVERPQFVHGLLRFLVEQRNQWHTACARHFDEDLGPTGLADDWLNVPFITPEMFADFVLPRYLEIEEHHGSIRNIHSCGNQTPLQPYLLEIKSLDVFEVSPWTDLTQTLTQVPASKRLGISLHPNDVLVASPTEMEAKLRFTVESCKGRSYSVGTSGLTPIFDTPQEFIDRIRTWTNLAREVLQG